MELDPNVCYRIIEARDPRFDGKFFTAVTTTGVYCRPICPARTPKRENVRFFLCAAQAEQAGFRPCKRCRPETAPGTPAWNGTATTINTALRLIGNGFLDEHSVRDLADRLGIGERHMRRLFLEHLGIAPHAIAQSRRAHFAARMLREADMRISHVALGAGFGSIRQFNDVFRAVFCETPGSFRTKRKMTARASQRRKVDSSLTFTLAYRPPFRWDDIMSFLGKRVVPGVEEVTDRSYRRSISAGKAAGVLDVKPAGDGGNCLRVSLEGIQPALVGPTVRRVRRMFDLDADPLAIADHLSRDARLQPAVKAAPGMRLPLTWDPFEAVVRAVIGQQISVAGAVTIVGRLAQRCGKALEARGTITRVFPSPADIVRADLSALGMPESRQKTLVAVSRAILGRTIRLDGSMPPDELETGLVTLPGIGPWSAQYVALRGLGEPDSFPESDLGIRKALDSLGYPKDRRERKKAVDLLAPWRGYAAIYLWQTLSTGG